MVGGHHLVPFVLPDGLALADRAKLGRGADGDLGRLGRQDVVADRDRDRRPRRDRAVAGSRVDERRASQGRRSTTISTGAWGGVRWGPSMSAGSGSRSPGPPAGASGSPPAAPRSRPGPVPSGPVPGPGRQATRGSGFLASPARPGQSLDHPPLGELELQHGAPRRPRCCEPPRSTSMAIRTAPRRLPAADSAVRSLSGRPEQDEPQKPPIPCAIPCASRKVTPPNGSRPARLLASPGLRAETSGTILQEHAPNEAIIGRPPRFLKGIPT